MTEYRVPLVKDEKDGSTVFNGQRELDLRYVVPVGDILPFYEGLKSGEVRASRCAHCGQLFFPPQSICPKCRKSDMNWIPLEGQAKLLAATMIFVKPKSFETEGNYLVAIGRLDEGVNVLAWLLTDEFANVKIGMRMRLTVSTNKLGNAIYVFVLA